MIEFIYHDTFKKECDTLKHKMPSLMASITAFERLCEVQFHPINPKQTITPKKLHRITQNNIWTLWKIELVIVKSGLRQNQLPRMWFAIKGSVIAFLCIATHIDNYNDNQMNKKALTRVTDIF